MEEKKARIPKAVIKRLVHSAGVRISDTAADALGEMLDKKAREIAAHAVANARKCNRKTILKDDIEDYAVKGGN